MGGIIHFETFLLAGIVLNLTPGNDTIFILTKSMTQGRKAGIVSVLGIATGSLMHTVFAAFGLSIVIVQSITLFNIIKYAGAAYLVYMGVKMLLDNSLLHVEETGIKKQVNYVKVYRDGLLTNLLNPKVALFFIAFLPQFIYPAVKSTVFPFILLGITFTITGTAWCMILSIFASAFFAKLKQNKRIAARINKVCGLVLVALGVKLALTKRSG